MKRFLLFGAACMLLLSFVGCNNPKGAASSRLFPAKSDGKYGFIDKTGKYVINPQFDDAEAFSEGLARVWIGDWKTGKY